MKQSTEILDVFLCHTGANKDWVRSLATRLESETIDDRPLRVFFDEWDIAPGENILARIEEGLSQARFVALALSPALTRAAWPTLEWQTQVYDDPTGKQGRIVPLIVQKFDPETLEPLEVPLPLRLLRYLDFSDNKQFENQYELLLARICGQRPGRGRVPGLVDHFAALGLSAGPEAASLVEEVLLGNLFPTQLPERIYSERSTTSSYPEIRKSFRTNFRTPFVLHKERLYSFVPPLHQGNPFRTFLTGVGRREERSEDLLKDPERARHLIWLCNDALRERCYALRLRTPPGQKNVYYPVVSEGEQRSYSWGKGPTLTLAKVNQGERPLGVHHAATMRFIQIGNQLHLLVEPRYFFTTDGFQPVAGDKAGRYSVRWGNKEGNRTVLRRMLMWPRILGGGQSEISLQTGGPESIKVAAVPRHGRSNRGILGDEKDIQTLLEGEAAGEVLGEEDDLDTVAEHARAELESDDEEYSGDDLDEIDDEQSECEPNVPHYSHDQELPF